MDSRSWIEARAIRPLGGKSQGFTLIELLLVVVLIGALAAMVVPRLAGRSEEALRDIAKADIKGNLALALRLYEVDNGRYPTTEQGLQALIQRPGSPPSPCHWKGPYLEQEPFDPWGEEYIYRRPGSHPPRDYDLLPPMPRHRTLAETSRESPPRLGPAPDARGAS